MNIKWNEYTWYSRLAALLFFIAILPAWTFYLGTQYQETKNALLYQPDILQSKIPSLGIDDAYNVTIPDLAYGHGSEVTLQNGVFTRADEFNDTTTTITLDKDKNSYAVGDINDDGVLDIVVTIGATTGGTGDFIHVVALINKNGKPSYSANAFLGDRVGVNKISIDKGIITADIITQGPHEPLCCGTLQKIIKFKLENNALVEVKS